MAYLANTPSTSVAVLSGRAVKAGNATPSTMSIGIKDISAGGGGGGGPIIPTEGIIWWPKRSS